jgi:hypothetical protein
MAYCEDCGTKLSGGICSNCSEELYIYNEQYEFLPDQISDKFMDKVREQNEKEKKRKKSLKP